MRTTTTLVQALLETGGDYNGTTDLQQFIDTATVIVSRVATCATRKGITLTAAELELIERWLAAHGYAMVDQPYKEKQTEKSSAKFQGETKTELQGTKYGQMALTIDYSGCLEAISKKQRASLTWLGKRPSEQIDYNQRD